MIKSRWKPRQWICLAVAIALGEAIQLIRGDWTWGHTLILLTSLTGALSLGPGVRPFRLERSPRPVPTAGTDPAE